VADKATVIEINDRCYLETDSHMLAIQIDRITFSLCVEEFLDFYFQLTDIKEFLEECPDYVLGKRMDGDFREVFVPRPEDSEYT